MPKDTVNLLLSPLILALSVHKREEVAVVCGDRRAEVLEQVVSINRQVLKCSLFCHQSDARMFLNPDKSVIFGLTSLNGLAILSNNGRFSTLGLLREPIVVAFGCETPGAHRRG